MNKSNSFNSARSKTKIGKTRLCYVTIPTAHFTAKRNHQSLPVLSRLKLPSPVSHHSYIMFLSNDQNYALYQSNWKLNGRKEIVMIICMRENISDFSWFNIHWLFQEQFENAFSDTSKTFIFYLQWPKFHHLNIFESLENKDNTVLLSSFNCPPLIPDLYCEIDVKNLQRLSALMKVYEWHRINKPTNLLTNFLNLQGEHLM